MNPPFDKTLFQNALFDGQIFWRRHVLEKMLERGISRAEVLATIEHGDIIRVYADDRPFPSILMMAVVLFRPIHVVVSFDEINEQIFVITAYEPDLTIFEADFKTKRT